MPDELNTTPTVSALTLDRAGQVGNSRGIDTRFAMHVKLKNDPNSEPIVVTLSDEPTTGTPFYQDSQSTTNPGTLQTIFSFVVPPLTNRLLRNVRVVCNMETNWQLQSGGSVIASGRTGAGQLVDFYPFDPHRKIVAGTTITLLVFSKSGKAPAPIEAYLQASDEAA